LRRQPVSIIRSLMWCIFFILSRKMRKRFWNSLMRFFLIQKLVSEMTLRSLCCGWDNQSLLHLAILAW